MCRTCIAPCTIKKAYIQSRQCKPCLWGSRGRERCFWTLVPVYQNRWWNIPGDRSLHIHSTRTSNLIKLCCFSWMHIHFLCLGMSHLVSFVCFALHLLHSFIITQISFVFAKVLWNLMASNFVRYWIIVTSFLTYDNKGGPLCSLFWWLNW
jgi:hypothetical protein